MSSSNSSVKEKLQALYWLKTNKLNTIKDVAAFLGRHRVTVQRWLTIYRDFGLNSLIKIKKSTGRPKAIPNEIVKKIETELCLPQGFQSYKEIKIWLETCHDLKILYRTIHQLVRYNLKAKLKVPRPVDARQKLDVVTSFKKKFQSN